jgi:integrase
MTEVAYQTLSFWAGNFPKRKPNHYVFSAEKYGAAGDEFRPTTYKTDPTKPIATWKEAWEAAKERAGIECRFHDLRGAACQRLRDAGVSYPVIGAIMGWSPATTILMTKRYGGEVGQDAKRGAMGRMETLAQSLLQGAQKRAQIQEDENATIQ